eukprot:CAMPEP_0167754236 /NCGR_PEP_ID=MMETSP0110_2-20121227/8155_1 /TAXON_ID=629695 /ORGANISM="Gymnochlora sp., Strain CCMP2014" /LENGTH=708 /DNA_ID=CAMNT_0007640087 /DNA_START=269 /DNA_END=2395 /DNA_ORIENTATION=+
MEQTQNVCSGAQEILNTFARCKSEGRPAFVAYTTIGYPTPEKTLDVIVALEKGGADVIELGVPFTDPLADGPTIQRSNQIALNNGVTSMDQCLDIIRQAREKGVRVPLVLMGYYNPFLMYGEEHLMKNVRAAGANGFIVVDLPPEEAATFKAAASTEGLSYIPLIAPTTTDDRVKHLLHHADSFVYAVSVTGVTGARKTNASSLPELLARIKKHSDLPVAVGFGVSSPEQFEDAGSQCDGVIVGSEVINQIAKAPNGNIDDHLSKFCSHLTGRSLEEISELKAKYLDSAVETVYDEKSKNEPEAVDDAKYRFGSFGGRYVPETLMEPLDELEMVYEQVKDDPEFIAECQSFYSYIGRPTPLHLADRLTEHAGGAKIWFKREDLNHTGAHKINNAICQALLAKRLGKKRIIAETGAGQHGVATATACAKLQMECIVYMGAADVERQALNVFRMEMLGAKVVAVDSGSRTLKDAINEAMRDWVTNIRTTHYLVGSAIGPHPFPEIVRDFQSIIGRESREQMLEKAGKLPDAVLACVGGGSNAIGMFHPFKDDEGVRLIGVEAAGDGVDSGNHSATLAMGTPGVLHGTKTYLLQETTGQITATHSISAGLDYPGVGPEHAHFKFSGRAEYKPVDDRQALLGFKACTMQEGIIPALETAHAMYQAIEEAKEMGPDEDVLVCVSGRGDKDIGTIRKALPKFGCKLNVRTIPDQ